MATSPNEDNVQATASEAPGSTDPPAEHEERVVETVARYEIFEEIARGGGGRILRGWDKVLDRDVVLKIPVRSTGTARLAREAMITAQLQHPAVVPVYSAGKLSDGTPFYVMKLVAGRSFRDEIANTSTLQGRLSFLPVMIAVCDAMAYAHSKRVIHRDLKPSNVLIGAFGETAVIDWGMAKRIDGTDTDYVLEESGMLVGSPEHTKTGAVLGTPAYMAPEQARGQEVDERADVYALGAMLYQQFTGERPYAGLESADIIRAVLDGTLPPVEAKVPQLPRELAAIVRKAMSPDAANRYPSAKELAEDLKRYQTGRLVVAHQYSAAALLTRWLRRNRVPVAVASLSIIALTTGGFVSVGRIVAEKNHADEQRAAAEELVDFMLVDLRERLRFVGKVSLLDGVTSKVDTYYQKLAAQGVVLDLGALRRKSQALSTLGRVREDEGNTAGAIEAQRAAAVLARQLVESPSAGDERWQDLVDALTELANMEVNSGAFAEGRADYDEALDISRKRLERAAGDIRWVRQKARILALIAYLDEHEGNVERSLELYREATSLQRPLADANPQDVEIAKDLAYSHGKYASRLAAAGRLDEALS